MDTAQDISKLTLDQYTAKVDALYDESDRIALRQEEIAAEIDALTYQLFEDNPGDEEVSVKRIAQIYDVVPTVIYRRLKRHKARQGIE